MRCERILLSIVVVMVGLGCTNEANKSKMEECQMSQNVVPSYSEKRMVGAYSDLREMTEEERQLFFDTYKEDLKLNPLQVATQVVSGMNYAFICEDETGNQFRVVIYKPIGRASDLRVTSVDTLSFATKK